MANQTDEDYTRVVFRRWPSGDVTAVLLDVPANRGYVTCYDHIGQHSEGRYFVLMAETRPAKPHEYAPLAKELTECGYKLALRKRRTVRLPKAG